MMVKSISRISCRLLFLACFMSSGFAYSFDWSVYVTKHDDLFCNGINTWKKALDHYLNWGAKQEGRTTAIAPLPESNFDWHYYVEHNNIKVNNEREALGHYVKHGFFLGLPYCKSLTFVIMLHLYNLDQMDDFIEQISFFIENNPVNAYHIKVNIPVDVNMQAFAQKDCCQRLLVKYPCQYTFEDYMQLPDNQYAKDLITATNYKNTYALRAYIEEQLQPISKSVQIIFSPNQGMDVGGFLLLMDQLIKQDIHHDFIVKVHTKTDPRWRELLTSFLRVHINPLLSSYDCIYTNRVAFTYDRMGDQKDNAESLGSLLEYFDLPPRNFYFCGGTMFIASRAMTDFFKHYNCVDLFAMFAKNRSIIETDIANVKNNLDGHLAHGFERLFGYLIDSLGLRVYCMDLVEKTGIKKRSATIKSRASRDLTQRTAGNLGADVSKINEHYLTKYGGSTEKTPSIRHANFDWRYYCAKNNLTCESEQEALAHYQREGYFKSLSYCQSYNITIMLDLRHIPHVVECIEQLNHFLRINPHNNYKLMVNIPAYPTIEDDTSCDIFIERVGDSVASRKDFAKLFGLSDDFASAYILEDNYQKLYKLAIFIQESIQLPREAINIVFSSPHAGGAGYFGCIDLLMQQGIKCDAVIFLHTVPLPIAYSVYSAFLHHPINPLLKVNEAIMTSTMYGAEDQAVNVYQEELFKNLLSSLHLPYLPHYVFPGHGMLIASSALLKFFKVVSPGFVQQKIAELKVDQDTEIALSARLLHYLVAYLKLKSVAIEPKSRPYQADNKICGTNCFAGMYSVEFLAKAIKRYAMKVMAIYFPQFHEVQENNQFWGPGFTEWTMLKNYTGIIKHPHIDIGYYDMLDYETRKKQGMIARQHGISAFCFYHYWFKDKKIMYKGIEKILEDGEPNMPFALCWANEPWTRNWDGMVRETLIPQEYGTEADWIAHYKYLAQFFKHPRYICENNCPVLYIYRIGHILDNNGIDMLPLWRKLAREDGFEDLKIIPFATAFSFNYEQVKNYVDGIAEFQPGCNMTSSFGQYISTTTGLKTDIDVKSMYDLIIRNKRVSDNYTRGIFYGWDHSSRRTHKPRYSFINLSYSLFEEFLINTLIAIAKDPNKGSNFILLNSWNEWTEQAMFEPNDYDGYMLLNIIKKYFGEL